MTKIILDGDPGHDDAIAWTLAQAEPSLEILGITTVSGNQTIDKTTYNARRIATLIDYTGPIARGAAKPLMRPVMTAGSVHGESGLDGPALPEPAPITDLRAVDLMDKIFRETEGKITLVPTGPLTNIALFLLLNPEHRERIEHISLMGGGIGFGNWTSAAEFNILVDPEAAKIVFDSGLFVHMFGLDVTLEGYLTDDERAHLAEVSPREGGLIARAFEHMGDFIRSLGLPGVCLHDALPILNLGYPELFTSDTAHVDVETKSTLSYGQTVTDLYSDRQYEPKNARIYLSIDREKFLAIVEELLTK